MALWYRPETLQRRQAGGCSLWLDSSGRGRYGSQGSAGSQPPITMIRLPRSRVGIGIEFDGSSDALDIAGNLDLDQFTLIAAAHRSAGATSGYRALISSNKWNLYANMNSSRWGLYGTGGVDSGQTILSGDVVTPGPPTIITAMNNGSTTALLTNGGALVSAGQASSASRGDRLGSDASGVQFFEGGLYEIVVYERALFRYEHRAVEEYMYRRFVEDPEYLLNPMPA